MNADKNNVSSKSGKKGSPLSILLLLRFKNRKSDCKTVDEEKEAIQHTTEAALIVYIQLLPGLLKKLSRIPDPRNPKKIKHQLTVLMIYGILMFVFQIPSRRQTNREMTTP